MRLTGLDFQIYDGPKLLVHVKTKGLFGREFGWIILTPDSTEIHSSEKSQLLELVEDTLPKEQKGHEFTILSPPGHLGIHQRSDVIKTAGQVMKVIKSDFPADEVKWNNLWDTRNGY